MISQKLLQILIWIFLFISASSLFPVFLWPQEISANFAPYYLVLHLCLIVSYAIWHKYFKKNARLILVLNIALVVWYTIPILPFYLHVETETFPAQQSIKVLYANVLTENQDHQKLSRLIAENVPDIIALVEMNQSWKQDLALAEIYPYHFEILREDNFGVAVYSKLAFNTDVISDIGEGLPPAFISEVKLAEGKLLRFVLLHTFPPVSQNAIFNNKLLLRRISSKLRFSEMPVILAGDMNATPFSSYYKNFLKWGYLKNAFWGQGLQSTWNAQIPWLKFRLDHLLYKGQLHVKSAKVLGDIGSDHLPLLVEFEG